MTVPWVPVVLGPILLGLTAWSWSATRLARGQVVLGFGWTWFWGEVFAAVAFAPPSPPPIVPIYQTGGEHGVHLAPDMLDPPDPDRPTVVFVGDSFTAGQGVALHDAFPSIVARALTATDPRIDVRNHGVPGDSFFGQAMRMPFLEHVDGADVIVHVFFLNDLGLEAIAGPDLVTQPGWAQPGVSPLLAALARTAQARAATARTEAAYHRALAPDGSPWRLFADQLPRLVHATRDRGARYVFVVFPILHQLDAYPFEDVHRRLVALAQDAGADAVDLLDVLRDRDAASLWFHPLDRHPNEAAHAVVASPVLDALRAVPIPEAAPVDCGTASPWPARWQTAWDARCADLGPAGLLDAARALAHDPATPRDGMVDGLLVAAGLAHLAAHRLPPEDPRHAEAIADRDRWVASLREDRP